MLPGNLVHVPLSSHGGMATAQPGVGVAQPDHHHHQQPQQQPGQPQQQQQFVPTSQQYGNSPAGAPTGPPQMWTTQVSGVLCVCVFDCKKDWEWKRNCHLCQPHNNQIDVIQYTPHPGS